VTDDPEVDVATSREMRHGGWRMMRRALRPSRGWIVVGVTAALSWTVAKVSIPLLAQRAIDHGIQTYRPAVLVRWGLIIFAVTLVIAVATALRRYAAFFISLRAEADLRRELFAHLQRLHFGYHDRAQTGQLMARANTDLRQIQLFLVFLPVAGANVVMVLGVAVVLFSIDARLAIFSLAALPFLNIAATRFSTRLHPFSAELQQSLADVTGLVEETLSGIRVVKGFGSESIQERRMTGAAATVFDRAMDIARLRASFTPLIDLLPTVGLIATLYVGGHEVLDHRLTVGQLIAFNFYILQLIFPLRLTAFLVAAASRASASAARVYAVMSTAPAIVDRPDAIAPPSGPGEVRFEGVRFGYGGDHLVLDGLDLVVQGGEALAVVGPTGSGKSTVARLIPRFYDVDGGAVRFDGVDVRALKLSELRRSIGIVFEDTFLFGDSVRTNIAFADPDAPQELVERAARLAGADEFIRELPDGYDTVLGERGFSLSGGQRQRIAIARAIFADPRVLVLDDATSSVDPTKEHEIRAAMREVMQGRTTVIIAHRPATVALADRVVLLGAGGRVVTTGTHEELLATSEEYRRVLAEGERRAAGHEADLPA